MTALRICYALNACVYAAVLFRRPPIAWLLWLGFLIAWTPWLIMEPGYSFTGYWRALPLALEAAAVIALVVREQRATSLGVLAIAIPALFLVILPPPYNHPAMPTEMWYAKAAFHLWAATLACYAFVVYWRPAFAAVAIWFAFSAWGNAQTNSGDLAAWIHASIIVSLGHYAAAVVWLLAEFDEAHPRTAEALDAASESLAHPHPD